MSFLSIIIPTLNSGKTLPIALGSILQQSFTDFEILIIDGISSDNTFSVVQSYRDERIKMFSEKDNGIYDAMNKGIKKASGDWLYFMGSDDILYDNRVLEQIYLLIQTTSNKIVYGNVKVIGEAGWASDGTIYDGCFSLEKLLSINICHQSIFYNRSVFKNIGNFDLKYPVWSDWEFNLRAWAKYIFTYVEINIACFEGGSTSFAIEDRSFLLNRWSIIYKYYKFRLYRSEFKIYVSNILNIMKSNKKPFSYLLVKFEILISRFF